MYKNQLQILLPCAPKVPKSKELFLIDFFEFKLKKRTSLAAWKFNIVLKHM